MPFQVILVTDRRLVPATDLPARIAAILAAVPPGSVAIQVREKDLDGGPLLALVRAVIAIARPLAAPVWVNDRVDVALAAGADGVHLPERGLSIEHARVLAREARHPLAIGCSRHTATATLAAAAAGAVLVQLGPIWSVPDKGAPLTSSVLALSRDLPATTRLVAVGGIHTPERAREVASAGAHAVAVIRAAWQSADAPALIASIVQSMK